MGRPQTATVYTAGRVRVVPRGDRFLVRWSEGGRQRERSAATLDAARELCDEHAARLEQGEPDHGAATVADVIVAYLADVATKDLEANTVAQRKSLLEVHVAGRIGEVRVRDVTPDHIRKIGVEMHAAGYSVATVAHVMTACRMLIDYGIRKGVWAPHHELREAAVVPAAAVRVATMEATERGDEWDRPTPAQVDALATALADIDPRHGLMCRLTATTGLRWGEVVALTWSSIDLVRGRVRVARSLEEVAGKRLSHKLPKSTRSIRTVPIFDRAVWAELSELAGESPDPTAPVFPSPGGALLRRSNFRARVLEPARAASGYPEHMGWHALRHYAISQWVDAGMPPEQASRLAGHASVTFTIDRYYSSDEDTLSRLEQSFRD